MPIVQSKKLLLFDIDGTLITTGGAGQHAFQEALFECHGISDDLKTIEFSGATDSSITAQLFNHHGIELTPEAYAQFKKTYLRSLQYFLGKCRPKGKVMPGLLELLPKLLENDHLAVSLLTGNFRDSGELKLRHYELNHFFDFEIGAFADDSLERNLLGPVALKRARERFGVNQFQNPFEDVLIIGDTPRDIACARALNAKVLAVATGRHRIQDLEEFQPDIICETLESTIAQQALFFKN